MKDILRYRNDNIPAKKAIITPNKRDLILSINPYRKILYVTNNNEIVNE